MGRLTGLTGQVLVRFPGNIVYKLKPFFLLSLSLKDITTYTCSFYSVGSVLIPVLDKLHHLQNQLT